MTSSGPVEMVVFSFQPDICHEDRVLFDQQVEHCERQGPPMIHGWSVPLSHTKDNHCNCAVLIKWASLDEMYEVKSDEHSVFNNGFVALKKEATEGTKTVLYTELRDAQKDQLRCLMM